MPRSAPLLKQGSPTVRLEGKFRPEDKPQGYLRLCVEPIEKTVTCGPPAVSA